MWIFLALLAAVLAAVREALVKVATRDVDEFTIGSALGLGSALLLLPPLLFTGNFAVRPGFWLPLTVSGVMNAMAAPLMARAVRLSDLSLVAPLQSFTPLFMIPLSAVVLREIPGPAGVAGIVTIVAGAYALKLRERAGGILAPLHALVAEPGARLMLAVALAFGVAGTFDKAGVQASNPLLWTVAMSATYGTLLLPFALVRARRHSRRMPAAGWRFLGIAIAATAAMLFFQMTAITMTLATYVIAVKRMSILASVLIGGVALREPDLRARLFGAAIMVAGFALVALG